MLENSITQNLNKVNNKCIKVIRNAPISVMATMDICTKFYGKVAYLGRAYLKMFHPQYTFMTIRKRTGKMKLTRISHVQT